MIKVGVISDTHKLVRPEALDALRGSDLIIHAGDIGSLEVIEMLTNLAPVRAIRGNVDRAGWAEQFPEQDVVEVEGKRIYVVHDVKAIRLDPHAAGFDAVVSGHSHKPLVRVEAGVVYVNPGSAGPRRFSLPVAVARLRVKASGVEAEICELPV